MSSRRNKSKAAWLQRHITDSYVERSQKDGFRSRAVYKLKSINQKYGLIKPNIRLLDLGSAPGSWLQYSAPLIGDRGLIVGVDILPVAPISNVNQITGDFMLSDTESRIRTLLCGEKFNLICSDIAPNITGVTAVDQGRYLTIFEGIVALIQSTLCKQGDVLIKFFEGESGLWLRKELSSLFLEVKIIKPEASRSHSRESYLLARKYKCR